MGAVAVCGSVNVDIFGYVDRLPAAGETRRGSQLAFAPGGKGANQAVAAARAGAVVRFAGARGRDDFGDQLAASLTADGIDLSELAEMEEPTGVALILVEAGGENQIVVLPGANDCVAAPQPDPSVDVWLTQAEVPLEAVEGTLAAARAGEAIALVNPSPAGRVPAALVARFDIAIVNENELAALGDERPPRVVLTLGSRGVRLLPDGRMLPAIPARAVDTTGAGDALAGATAAALADGRPLEQAVEWGIAAASVSVERLGCQPAMPSRQEIEQRLREAVAE
jgi:ribokinase